MLDYSWRGNICLDRVLPFGLRSSDMFCQRFTDAIAAFLFRDASVHVIIFLDDFGGADTVDKARQAFTDLIHLLHDLGVGEAVHKAVSPSTCMVFLGTLIDTVNMTVSVPEERFRDIPDVLAEWLSETTTSKREVQSLISK